MFNVVDSAKRVSHLFSCRGISHLFPCRVVDVSISNPFKRSFSSLSFESHRRSFSLLVHSLGLLDMGKVEKQSLKFSRNASFNNIYSLLFTCGPVIERSLKSTAKLYTTPYLTCFSISPAFVDWRRRTSAGRALASGLTRLTFMQGFIIVNCRPRRGRCRRTDLTFLLWTDYQGIEQSGQTIRGWAVETDYQRLLKYREYRKRSRKKLTEKSRNR